MLNVHGGTVTTGRNGTARVRLPSYFEALNTDFRYQLTVVGDFAQAVVAEEVKDNAFTIRTDPGRVKVCWQVTGVRQDAWAQLNRIEAEQKKPRDERGKYLHPELFGRKAVGIHPAPATRFDEVVPDGLREWAAGLSADLATPAAKPTGKLNAARRLLHKTMAFDRSRIDQRAGAIPGMPAPKPGANVATRVDAARRWLEGRGAAGRAKLDAQWREVEQMVEVMRP